MAFVREFSVAGEQLGLSARENSATAHRVRVGIYRAGRQCELIPGAGGVTYSEGFWIAYGETLERRSKDRGPAVDPLQLLDGIIDDDDDDELDE